ncbi:MAG: crossover junction endodeoxyribonuclease RuvC [Candidatus Spechtbacterales bacterium]
MHNTEEKVVLGIDPGTARMGYGVINYKNPDISCVEYGVLETETKTEEALRLKDLYKGLNNLIHKHNPDVVAIEDIFYFKNQKTLVQVSQARGIALLAATNNGKKCYSFTPLQVKQAVVGYGQAEKHQVQEMVKAILHLEDTPKPDDAADALAVAISCAHSLKMLQFSEK